MRKNDRSVATDLTKVPFLKVRTISTKHYNFKYLKKSNYRISINSKYLHVVLVFFTLLFISKMITSSVLLIIFYKILPSHMLFSNPQDLVSF